MAANTFPRVESATQSHWIDTHRTVFLEQLNAQGYNQGTVAIYARVATRFCAEVRRRDLGGPVLCADDVKSVQAAVLADTAEHSRPDAIYPLKRFLGYLAASGVAVLPAVAQTPTALERLGQEYERYLRHQRGLSDTTIYHCMRFYVRFMTFRFGEDLGDLEAITPDDIVDYLLTFRRGPTASRDKTRRRICATCSNSCSGAARPNGISPRASPGSPGPSRRLGPAI